MFIQGLLVQISGENIRFIKKEFKDHRECISNKQSNKISQQIKGRRVIEVILINF